VKVIYNFKNALNDLFHKTVKYPYEKSYSPTVFKPPTTKTFLPTVARLCNKINPEPGEIIPEFSSRVEQKIMR
jgi:hypothetical protein